MGEKSDMNESRESLRRMILFGALEAVAVGTFIVVVGVALAAAACVCVLATGCTGAVGVSKSHSLNPSIPAYVNCDALRFTAGELFLLTGDDPRAVRDEGSRNIGLLLFTGDSLCDW